MNITTLTSRFPRVTSLRGTLVAPNLYLNRASAKLGASGIITRVIDDVRNFSGSQPQNDDITMIAIHKT